MSSTLDLALLILRVVAGLTMAAHGAQKLFGWFGGAGFTGMQHWFAQLGHNPSWLWLSLAILGEIGGGASVALGFLTPVGAAGIFGTMFMALFQIHWKNGFFAQQGGYEYSLLMLAVSICIGIAGPGSYSLDALLGITLPGLLVFVVLAVAAAIVDCVGIVASRQKKTTAATQ